MLTRSYSVRIAVTMAISATLAAVAGCPSRDTDNSSGQSFSAARQRSIGGGEALLDSVVGQLRDLPEYVELDMSPPSVILDATTSRDGQEVMATLGKHPDAPEEYPLHNLLVATSGNGRFRAVGVKPGDIVKYFVLRDEKAIISEEQIFGTGPRSGSDGQTVEDTFSAEMARKVSIDLTVAQVLSDDALLIEGGLPVPVEFPEKIQIWRYANRVLEIDRRLNRYHQSGKPSLGWEPTPDERVVSQLPERLNQWLRQSQPQTEWQAAELLATLPDDLGESEALAPIVAPEALGESLFKSHEGRLLQQAVWLRDISDWARGEGFDDLARARALFDWTVRNVQLDDDAQQLPYRPWQTLMYAHGTAAQRAWVFAALCRQQNLDVVILPTLGEDGTEHLLAALVHDNRCYLFDPALGLPIPGPDGDSVASLDEVLEDDGLLRALDLPGEAYPVTADQLREATAQIVATPFELSRRARLLDQTLLGEDRMVLSVDTARIERKVRDVPGVSAVRLWDFPFRMIKGQLTAGRRTRNRMAAEFQPFAWRPMLWKARVLHFQGKRDNTPDTERDALADVVDSHRDAARAYMHDRVRPPDRLLRQQTSDQKRRIYTTVKQRASLGLGLISYDQGRYDPAVQWLSELALESGSDDPWLSGAQYNLARAHEALGQTEQAIALYESDTSPQSHGNRLRARRLRDATAATDQEEQTPGSETAAARP